jgi:hypothetical protein
MVAASARIGAKTRTMAAMKMNEAAFFIRGYCCAADKTSRSWPRTPSTAGPSSVRSSGARPRPPSTRTRWQRRRPCGHASGQRLAPRPTSQIPSMPTGPSATPACGGRYVNNSMLPGATRPMRRSGKRSRPTDGSDSHASRQRAGRSRQVVQPSGILAGR